jgi:hypothetical protein
MKTSQLREILLKEVDRWAQKSIDELRSAQYPVSYNNGKKGQDYYQTKVIMLEDLPEYVHIGVAVDDGGIRAFILPPSTSFIVHADGRVEK